MTDDTAPIYDDKAQVRGQLNLADAQWRVSSEAERDEGNVEVADVPHSDGVTYTVMRNSAQPEGPVLVFTPGEWKAFIGGAEDGEFDEPW